jgi:quercetin dioxygenase-like cupin family protein
MLAGASLVTPSVVMAHDVPDALSEEWQGKKPCEKLFEDAQVRIAWCTFLPGAMHLCHSHPSYFTYVLRGGQAQVQDERGTRKIDFVAGAFVDAPPTPRHQFVNIGETTVQVLVVEKKYQAVSPLSRGGVSKINAAAILKTAI